MNPSALHRMAVLAALATALLAPGASAATGDLGVDRVALQGEAVLDGRCRVLLYLGPQATDSASLTVTGESLRMELDTIWANTSAPGVGVGREHGTSRDEFNHGTFQATAFRADHGVFLADVPGLAPPRVQWSGTPGHLEDSRPGTLEQPDRPPRGDPERPERSVDLQGSASWTPAPGWIGLSVTGDFYVALWEVDGQASDASHEADYATGQTAEGPTTGILPPALAAGRYEARLLHVFARNATLVWQFKSDGLLAFHVNDAAVDSQAPILLSGATGVVRDGGGSLDVQDAEVRLASGRLDAVRPTPAGLGVSFTAPREAVALNGQPAVFPRQDSGLPPWGVATAAAVLALALAFTWHWSRSGLRRLERDMDEHRYADAVARRGRVRIPASQAPQASVLHAVSLIALHEHDKAGHFLEALPAPERPEQPTFCYLLALVRAEQGRTAEAGRLLRDCLAVAPEYFLEVVANPSLLGLLDGSGHPRPLREGAEGGG